MKNHNHFIAGGIAGITEVLVTNPFEVLKTNLHIKNDNIFKICQNIYKNKGLIGFYAGYIPYTIQCSIKLGFRFSSYNFINNKLTYLLNKENMYTNFSAGLISGTAESLILTTPTERMKIIQQTKKGNENIIKKTIQKEGISTIFKGYEATSLRQSTSMAIRFSLYNPLKNKYSKYFDDINFVSLLSGGTAGLISSIINNPIDVIKTNQQKVGNNLSFIKVIDDIYQRNGIKGFYKGVVLRGIKLFIAQSVVFCTYENVLKILK